MKLDEYKFKQRERYIEESVREILYNYDKFRSVVESIPSEDLRIGTICEKIGTSSYTTVNRLFYEYGLDKEFVLKRYRSNKELEICEYLDSIGVEYIPNCKRILPHYELDIYIPNNNIAIEFNGIYWHSETIIRDNDYHYNKSMDALDKGIFIYHIWENEWNDLRKQIIIKSQINNLVGINSLKIYARNCDIREVGSYDAGKFLNDNHIQGNRNSSVRYGLYYNNELVSLMTFGKDKFIDKSDNWQLLRFCSKLNTTVVGGASKLFKKFIDTYNPNIIISYCDIAKGRGNTYKKLGFTLDHITPCNYVWWSPTDGVKTRYQCQKRFIKESELDDRTEYEIMTSKGFSRVFDCGSYKFIYRCN